VLVGLLLPVIAAGAIFLERAPRPLEQGGDAFSDANAVMAGRNFDRLGFARLHFLPVILPDPAQPDPRPDEYYTRYPPGADLVNGLLRRLGIESLAGWRRVSAAASLAGLVFWFLALRALFGSGVAVAGVAAYALNFSFVWLGDSIHHYGMSDLLRSLAFWLGVRVGGGPPRRAEVLALAAVLFAQSLLAFDYIPYSHVLLLGLGATALRGPRLRLLLLFAAMPVLGVALHLAQNVSLLGPGAALGDFFGVFRERAFAEGLSEGARFTLASLVRIHAWNTQQLMGVGLGTIFGFAAMGMAAWLATAPAETRGRAPRVVLAMAAASLVWFVAMHQHAGVHPYSNRQLLPLASLAIALGLAGVHALVARVSRPLALGAVAVTALALAADGYSAYANDANRRQITSRSFAIAYASRERLPAGVAVATNLAAPSPPALAALIDRRVRLVRSLPELESAFGNGTPVTYLYSRGEPIDPALVEFLQRGRVLHGDASGVAVEVAWDDAAPPAP